MIDLTQPKTAVPPRVAVSHATDRGSELLLWTALLLVTVLVAYTVNRPLSWLLAVVPDDAFYYLGTARHIAADNFSSFDGLNPTNGYHPGWMALLVVCAKLFSQPTALLRACLVTAFLFHVAAALCLVAALRRWVSKPASCVAGALWLLNPLAVTLVIQGMEAAFYIFALALALLVFSTRVAPHLRAPADPPSLRDLALFGASLSLCFLGRTEAVVLAGVVTLALAWSLRRWSWLRPLLWVGTSFCAGIVPWFVYSYWATSSWFQRSGAMKMLWSEGLTASATRMLEVFNYLFGDWTTYPVLGALDGVSIAWRALVSAVLTVAITSLLVRGASRPQTRPAAAAGLVLMLATLLTGLVYALFFADTQYWYKAQPGFVLFVVVFVVAVEAAKLASGWKLSRWRWVVALAAGTSAITLLYRITTLNFFPWQPDVLTSHEKFEDLVPEGSVIGCFNAGIPGYFGKHRVVNLDGLVNNVLYDYYRRREFDRYLTDANITYIVDEPDALRRASYFARDMPSLEVISSAPLTGWWSSARRYLWRRSDAAATAP